MGGRRVQPSGTAERPGGQAHELPQEIGRQQQEPYDRFAVAELGMQLSVETRKPAVSVLAKNGFTDPVDAQWQYDEADENEAREQSDFFKGSGLYIIVGCGHKRIASMNYRARIVHDGRRQVKPVRQELRGSHAANQMERRDSLPALRRLR